MNEHIVVRRLAIDALMNKGSDDDDKDDVDDGSDDDDDGSDDDDDVDDDDELPIDGL